MSNEDAYLKRIVKAYLFFKGEATARDILIHIEEVGYGLRKPQTSAGISAKINYWNKSGHSGSWFKVERSTKNRKTYWRLKK